jgi:hypothetical protein
MREVTAKIIFTAEVKDIGYAITAEKVSSVALIPSVREGKKYVIKAANAAQKRAEKALALTYGTSESAAPSVRVSEKICKNTESPDQPPAAAARMTASLGSLIDVHAAHPEVSSKKEKISARRG